MSDSSLRYRVFPRDPHAHLFEVSCTVDDPSPEGQQFSMAAWIPGSYLIREFAKHIVSIHATSNGKTIAINKTSKDTWRCHPCAGPLTVVCLVYAFDLSVRAAYLDTSRGFFNGTSVFLRVHGREERTCLVVIDPPDGAPYRDWRVATSLPRDGAALHGFGAYRVQSYDELVDHPVEMGIFEVASFEALGLPHDIVLTGLHRADLGRLQRDLQAICEHHISFFGDAPFERYVFLANVLNEGYGGLEHRASTSLICGRDDLPKGGVSEVTEGYRSFLGLVSHEYFHAWNVKRIKPAAFLPYDYQSENYTRQLWAFEGVTSYYDDLALVRTGLITTESYLELLAQTITRVLRTPGRFRQSVAESSFDAWIKFYRQDENSPNAIVSYYAKGALIALSLDLLLRSEFHSSLDTLMRALWERYGRKAIGVPEGGIEQLAEEVAGCKLGQFFESALYGTDDLPIGQLLERFGVRLMLRPAESDSDKGGAPAKNPERLERRAVLGVRWQEGAGEARVAQVFDGGAAQQAGLSAGDLVVAIDGVRVTRANIEKVLADYAPGAQVRIHGFRRDLLIERPAVLHSAPRDTCFLVLIPDAGESVQLRRDAWLRGL